MNKLLVFVMCLTLICGYSYADQTSKTAVKSGKEFSSGIQTDGISVRGAASLDDKEFIDDPDGPNPDVRCTCEEQTLCGTPVEDDGHNNSCSHPDPTQLYCFDTIYGKSCDNSDYYKVWVPAHQTAVVTLNDGENCDRNPTVYAKMRVYNSSCAAISDYSFTNFELQNTGAIDSWVVIRVRQNGEHYTAYSLHVECQSIPDPCDPGQRDYCADPIIIPAGTFDGFVYHYDNTENCRGATDVIAQIPTNMCGTELWDSGLDLVYKMVLEDETVLDITSEIPGGGDAQVMVVMDCADPANTCVASKDLSYTAPEVISNLTLQPETYYVIVSVAERGNCGEIKLTIEGDHPLPVELTGFDAIAGDGEIALDWSTASEANADYFDILRDGVTAGRIAASNSVIGYSYTWTDLNLTNGREYTYDLVAVNLDGTRETVGTVSATPTMNEASVTEYALHQNYPNPFNPETNIMFDLVEAGNVRLTVFNPLGQTIATLVNGTLESGRHTVSFDGANYTSGLYYYRLEAGDFTAIRKMVLMK